MFSMCLKKMIQIIKNQKLKSYFIFCNVEITSYNNIIKGRDGLAMLKSGVFFLDYCMVII